MISAKEHRLGLESGTGVVVLGVGGQRRLPMRVVLEQDSQESEVKAMLVLVGERSRWTEPRGCKGCASEGLGVGGGSTVDGAKGEW